MRPLILASSSPQRQEILSIYAIEYRSIAPNIDESLRNDIAENEVQRIAIEKCENVLERDPAYREYWILSADTLIAMESRVLGKPACRGEAEKMLQDLSGNYHRVLTGIALFIPQENRIISSYEETAVHFIDLKQAEIDWYLDTNEWKGAAGGYRIQKRGEFLVSSLKGSYGNVVGLPIRPICGIVAPYISDACPLCNLPGLRTD